ncbi:energy transducer TonB [Tenacibaculum amylolyticum]|uniref:energy transducer TonB n=1 Tax=Tenacibaculum amylolyticum TaxID=104269 RepID=UPI0038B59F25
MNSISKCTIEKDKDATNKRKVVLNVASKKTRKRIIRKRSKANSIGNNTENLQQNVINNNSLEIKNDIITRSLASEEILFSIVEEVPLFPECENITKNQSDCFNTSFSKHFAKNFDPERASEDGVSGKVFIQFTIDTRGNTNNLLIKSRKKDKQLENEIERVLKKLPTFSPGRHKGIPVNVKYSLPINFSAE